MNKNTFYRPRKKRTRRWLLFLLKLALWLFIVGLLGGIGIFTFYTKDLPNLNQLNEPKEERPICIYVSIGQKESKTARIVAELASLGAMEYTIVVAATASDPCPMQFLSPYTGKSVHLLVS